MSWYRTSAVLAALLLAVAGPASAQRWGQPPAPRAGVCFYEDDGFNGRYFCAALGESNAHLPAGSDDHISSIRVFGDAVVTVYKDGNFHGDSRTFESDVYSLRREGFNDRVTSFEVGRRRGYGGRPGSAWDRDRENNRDRLGDDWRWGRENTPRAGICFYEDTNFRGDYFCAPVGRSMSQVPRSANDRISSIRVFGNAEIIAFQDRDFEGNERRFNYDVRDLRRAGFDDRISSFRVVAGGSGTAPGWGNKRRDVRRVTIAEAQQIVRRAYLSVLAREPDAGAQGYVNHVLNDNWTQGQVENELRKSPEYRQKAGRR